MPCMCWAGWAGWSGSFSRFKLSILRKSTLDATSLYWHFMDVLWVYLLLLLWIKLLANLTTRGGTVSHADAMGGPAGVMEKPAFSVPAKKLAMWLFIMSDVMTFAGCAVAYAFLRNATPDWPRPFHTITSVAAMTVIMLTSSLTMLVALEAAKAADKAKAFQWMIITAAAGVLFTLLHIRDWMGMISQGVTLFHNPWSPAPFGAAFYSITGFT